MQLRQLKNAGSFIARVLSVKPSAEYQGVVYDQIVALETEGGTRISLFDPRCLATSKHIGSKFRVFVAILEGLTDPRPNPKRKYGFEQKYDKNAIVMGKIISLEEDKSSIIPIPKGRRLGVISTGDARFYFGTRKKNLKPGQYVTFGEENGRLIELLAIRPVRPPKK